MPDSPYNCCNLYRPYRLYSRHIVQDPWPCLDQHFFAGSDALVAVRYQTGHAFTHGDYDHLAFSTLISMGRGSERECCHPGE
jgi:hypothetical protein